MLIACCHHVKWESEKQRGMAMACAIAIIFLPAVQPRTLLYAAFQGCAVWACAVCPHDQGGAGMHA